MIFPSRSQLASKQITGTGRAEAVTKKGLAATLQPRLPPDRPGAPRTSARSNGTTSFSTASTSSIVPGSAKERVLMLYFNTNVGATLAPHQPRQSEQVCPTQRTLHLGHERGRASQHGGVAPEADLPETVGLPAGGSGAISAVNRRIPIATPLLTSSLGGPDACPFFFSKNYHIPSNPTNPGRDRKALQVLTFSG